MHQEPDSLDKVKQEFTEWRAQRPRMGKIPTRLWDLVLPLLDDYPRSMISRVLGISASQIRNNVDSDKVTFVEAANSQQQSQPKPSRAAGSEQCCEVELKRPCGSTLMISSLPISVLATLIPSFVGN